MKTKHAKEKWESILRSNGERGVRNKGGFICFLPKPTHYSGQDERKEAEDHAKLIAAAPELLELIMIMNEDYNRLSTQNRLNKNGLIIHKKIKEAIKKAIE